MPRRTVNVGLRNAAIMNGEEDLSDWDMEELRRGRRRDKHGGWRGKDPKVVPKAIHTEWVSRFFEEVNNELNESALPAVKSLSQIATHPDIDPDTRLKAIGMILDRVLGKPTERVSITSGEADPPWVAAMQGAMTIVAIDSGDYVLDVPSEEVE